MEISRAEKSIIKAIIELLYMYVGSIIFYSFQCKKRNKLSFNERENTRNFKAECTMGLSLLTL